MMFELKNTLRGTEVGKSAVNSQDEIMRSASGSFDYWNRYKGAKFENQVLRPRASLSHDRYITFEDDTGGWNNIRMAFEVFVVAAKATGRILVLPPRVKFYLLDRGPITVFKKAATRTNSSYDDYYDMTFLRPHVTIITTDEFLERESSKLNMPPEIVTKAKTELFGNGHHSDYFLWLRESTDSIWWPSGPIYDPEWSLELKSIHPEKKLIHFPMQVGKGLRYLSGVPFMIQNTKDSSVNTVRKFVRSSLVYVPRIREVAEEYVRQMGGFDGFFSLHVRRNELQYKSAFASGDVTAKNVAPLIKPGEKVYIATDEVEEGFFNAFKEKNIEVFVMSELREKVRNAVGPVHPRLEGMIEQLICASSRVFVGTQYSSFTAHIQRLRGYMRPSPAEPLQTSCLFHTKNLGDELELNKLKGKCKSAFSFEVAMSELIDENKT
eukprot:CAMPEP_0203761874 /NCGR_PEP_ID=MMETSP0098-20131031/14870_1 /ASSEMBLY_ACC=CAM_ASM_000208 /TAXON_ID=96639 /ORGANISM=" , Strain NY0313808BC1" /LENGTH=436 /DNA_ID=CAMNT_0050656043 /DNA_START=377 /DNA_END=1687 /DNA_ORIENTATION=+